MFTHPIHINSLQYLRVLAIFFVFFLHTKLPGSFGNFGVDIFFVISGYVMALIVSKEIEPSSFLKDRIFRIVPLYWLLTFLFYILVLFYVHKMGTEQVNAEQLIYSLFFIPFYRSEGSITPILTIGWTLMFEMLFYVVMFVTLLYKKYINKKINQLLFCSVFIVFLHLISTLFRVTEVFGDKIAILEFLSSQNLYTFLFGIFAYWLNCRQSIIKKPTLPYFYIFGFFIALILCIIGELTQFKLRVIFLGIPAFFVVLCATRIEFTTHYELPKLLQTPLLVLANISYGFYLAHIFVLSGMKKIGEKIFPFLAPDQYAGAFIALILAISVSALLYYLFDRPVNHWLRAQFNQKKSKFQLI